MLNRLGDVFRSFHDREVRYLVVGGVAAILYGVPRATLDLDVLIEATPDNARRLLDALLAAGLGTASLTSVEALLANEITIFNDRVRVDVLTTIPGVAFARAWERRRTMRYGGQEFLVLDREDLIASKRATGRSVDLEDVRLLELSEERGPEGPA